VRKLFGGDFKKWTGDIPVVHIDLASVVDDQQEIIVEAKNLDEKMTFNYLFPLYVVLVAWETELS
jgi:hypothetical protein